MTPDTERAVSAASPPQKKPRLAFLLATWFGLGYLPKAPGTWGSLGGIALSWLILRWAPKSLAMATDLHMHDHFAVRAWGLLLWSSFMVALLGVWSSSRVANFSGSKDPQFVVIDEVSGQMLALLSGASALVWLKGIRWSILVAGFVLFRLFDIWKPWPIRKLEKLPGGWGIMADDWLAGIYAAILLRLALHFNVL